MLNIVVNNICNCISYSQALLKVNINISPEIFRNKVILWRPVCGTDSVLYAVYYPLYYNVQTSYAMHLWHSNRCLSGEVNPWLRHRHPPAAIARTNLHCPQHELQRSWIPGYWQYMQKNCSPNLRLLKMSTLQPKHRFEKSAFLIDNIWLMLHGSLNVQMDASPNQKFLKFLHRVKYGRWVLKLLQVFQTIRQAEIYFKF